MSYEYKEEILSDIGPEPNCNYESESNRYYDKIDELDEVYAQAAKADEYEAKAEAFDGIVEKYEGVMKGVRNRKFKVTSDVTLLGLEVEKAIKKYESGEPNE